MLKRRKLATGYDPGEARVYGEEPAPAPELAGLVTYWSATSRGLSIKREMLTVPDEHVEILFDFRSAGTAGIPLLVGVQKKARQLKPGCPVELVGIKFMPGSFYSLFRVPVHRFCGKVRPLSSALGQGARPFCGVFKETTLQARVRLIDNILLGLAKNREPLPPALERGLKKIHASKGAATVREMAADAGWTERWFLEVFKKWTGTTPQLFCGNLKFAAALHELGAGSKPASVAQETGYSDQAHLHREFKRHVGYKPRMTFDLPADRPKPGTDQGAA